jgi:hypothetical protein
VVRERTEHGPDDQREQPEHRSADHGCPQRRPATEREPRRHERDRGGERDQRGLEEQPVLRDAVRELLLVGDRQPGEGDGRGAEKPAPTMTVRWRGVRSLRTSCTGLTPLGVTLFHVNIMAQS